MEKWQSLKNKYLLVMPGVILTKTTDGGIFLLDKHFKQFNATRYVTSAYRSPKHQLEVIISYCKKLNITVNFVSDDFEVKLKKSGNYLWQEAWSQLQVKHLIINPPLKCACLYDHTNSNGTLIKAGTIYDQSKHTTGDCFDMSIWRGNPIDNIAPNVEQEKKIIQVAKDLDPEIGIISYVSERANNCLHVNLKHQNEV